MVTARFVITVKITNKLYTFASWLVETGAALYTIKEFMGHSFIKMTERYAHPSSNKMCEAMKAFI